MKVNKLCNIGIAAMTVVCVGCAASSHENVAKTNVSVAAESDQWAYTDGLGRTARDYASAGEHRDDKYVGLFYWTWHNNTHDPAYRVVNIPHVLAEHPEAINDYDSPYWGGEQKPEIFFWGEPIFGYYQTTDKWVLRKHAEMLADAGVDVVFFDCTNSNLLFEDSFNALCQTWIEAQQDGVKVPKVAFILPLWIQDCSVLSLRRLYEAYYSQGKYEDLWFYWDGKPMIMAWPDNLTDSELDNQIKDFFTFRRSQAAYNTPDFEDKWGWLQVYPQKPGYRNPETGRYEQTTVGVAQNTRAANGESCCAFNLPDTYGRSFSKTKGWDPRPDGYLYGWNFQEQWDRAIDSLDVDLIFVTGWNEWHSGMWTKADGWTDPVSFVDQFDWDHSRDCEPTLEWGDKGDAYYWQLVDQIRRFKGMKAPAKTSEKKTIRFNTAGEWDDVLPRYKAYKGNTFHRDYPGYYEKHYTNASGRNDIVGAQVAHDDNYVYFRVETAEALTSPSDRNWMQLFIDVDRDKSTGWYGYDFVINHTSPTADGAVLESCVDNKWQWSTVGNIKYSVADNVLELAVPKELIGVSATPDFEFKWNDNMQDDGNVMDFYVNGDSAPGGRFNYVYSAVKN